jgi:hypothetical protein
VTKAALFVQSAGLVGMGVSGVVVALASTDGVDGVSAAVGASVTVATRVSGVIGTAVSMGACVPQAGIVHTRKIKTTSNFFLIKTSFLFETAEEDNFIIYKN